MTRLCPRSPPLHWVGTSQPRLALGGRQLWSLRAWVGPQGWSVLTGGPGSPLPCKAKHRVRALGGVFPDTLKMVQWVLGKGASEDGWMVLLPAPHPRIPDQGPASKTGTKGMTPGLLQTTPSWSDPSATQTPLERTGWHSPLAQVVLGVPDFPEEENGGEEWADLAFICKLFLPLVAKSTPPRWEQGQKAPSQRTEAMAELPLPQKPGAGPSAHHPAGERYGQESFLLGSLGGGQGYQKESPHSSDPNACPLQEAFQYQLTEVAGISGLSPGRVSPVSKMTASYIAPGVCTHWSLHQNQRVPQTAWDQSSLRWGTGSPAGHRPLALCCFQPDAQHSWSTPRGGLSPCAPLLACSLSETSPKGKEWACELRSH